MAQALIAKLDDELREQISVDGWDWIITALDPFHDVSHKVAGWPDLSGAPSVVLEITRTINLSGTQLANGFMHCFMCPFSSTAPNFGFGTASIVARTNIANLFQADIPVVSRVPGSYVTSAAATLNADTTGDLVINVVNVDTAGIAGTGIISMASSGSFMPVTSSSFVLRHGITTPHRLIGAGFEVVNNTAPLYRSGNVVVYDVPANPTPTNFVTSSHESAVITTAVVSSNNIQVIQGPPATISQAILLPNSKQWNAEEGSYNVMKFHSLHNPPVSNFPVGTDVLVQIQGQVSFVAGSTNIVAQTTPNSVGYVYAPTMQLYPCNGTGAWYTGLDVANTSFQITAKWYLEAFPNVYSDASLIPTISPSAAFDPLALHIYADVIAKMPPGVPVKDNFLGLVGSAIGGIAKKAIGGVVNTVSKNLKLPSVGTLKQGANAVRDYVDYVINEPQFAKGFTDKAIADLNKKMPQMNSEWMNLIRSNKDDVGKTLEAFEKKFGALPWFSTLAENRMDAGMPEFTGVPRNIDELLSSYSTFGLHQNHPSPVNDSNMTQVNRNILPVSLGQPAAQNHQVQNLLDMLVRSISSVTLKPSSMPRSSYEELPCETCDVEEASEAQRNRRKLLRQRKAAYVKECKAAGVPWSTGVGVAKKKPIPTLPRLPNPI